MDDSARSQKPTNSEMGILEILWRTGASTVREVHAELSKTRDLGYTTVLKFMQVMVEKGLLVRDEHGKAHVYRTAESPESAKRHLLADLIDRAFSGSSQNLVMHALAAKKATPEELAEIRKMIDQLEKSSE